ncbi:hypothetical protein H4218_002354 [Coemansia sp. IMI 209128]|nr:hypothetical protein H4218_002354 [Coemansia sp. IMI 209128]
MNAQQLCTDSSSMMNGFGSGYHPSQQRQADDDLAALNEFLAASSVVASAQQSRQPVVSVNDQTMAAILASASAAYPDQPTLAMAGSASPLILASIGVTPSQSMQASHFGDMGSDAATLSAANFTSAQACNAMPSADMSGPLYSQALSSFDAASLTAMLGNVSQSPYSASHNGGVFDVPIITEQPASNDFLAPPPSNFDQLSHVLGKRKSMEYDDGPMNFARGVPLSKRVSMPAYFGDRNTGVVDSSVMPMPTGVGMQRIASYHPGVVSTGGLSPDMFNPFSMVSGGNSAIMSGAVSPSKLLPISRLDSTASMVSNAGAGINPASLNASAPLPGQQQESGAAPVPQQQRKVAHNAIERRYRNNINDRISDLRNAVPALQHVRAKKKAPGNSNTDSSDDEEDDGGDEIYDVANAASGSTHIDGVAAATKLNKATILGKSTEYIYYLRRNNDQLKRESLYLQELIRNGFPDGEKILATVLQRAKQESAVATVLLHPPEKPARPSKRK